MTAEEFVKQTLPKAKAERQVTNGGEAYWLIRNGRDTMYIASGNSKSNAWVNAKKTLQK